MHMQSPIYLVVWASPPVMMPAPRTSCPKQFSPRGAGVSARDSPESSRSRPILYGAYSRTLSGARLTYSQAGPLLPRRKDGVAIGWVWINEAIGATSCDRITENMCGHHPTPKGSASMKEPGVAIRFRARMRVRLCLITA